MIRPQFRKEAMIKMLCTLLNNRNSTESFQRSNWLYSAVGKSGGVLPSNRKELCQAEEKKRFLKWKEGGKGDYGQRMNCCRPARLPKGNGRDPSSGVLH